MIEPGYLRDEELDVDPEGISPEQQRRMAILACDYASRQDDPHAVATDLLAMLGLRDVPEAERLAKRKPHPSVGNSGRCIKCGVATYQAHPKGAHTGRRYGARGLCQACYAVIRRAERKADAR